MNNILIIEDDPAIALGLNTLLEKENYNVSACSDGKEGLQKALETIPDLILLDVNLPSLNGFEICRSLRENKFLNPVIMLTSHSDQVDKVVGLEIGADDYLTKPFDNRELIARIRAQLRKFQRIEGKNEIRENLNRHPRRLLTVMFTDIQGYSGIMNKNEIIGLKILETHNKIMNECIMNDSGKVIEIVGDAFLVSFQSALEAVTCAVNIQKKLKELNKYRPVNEKIKVRIGIHLGDVVEFEGKLKGDVINIAARIQQNAKAGSVYFSGAVYSAVKNKTELKIKNAGKHNVKNIHEPLEFFSIQI